MAEVSVPRLLSTGTCYGRGRRDFPATRTRRTPTIQEAKFKFLSSGLSGFQRREPPSEISITGPKQENLTHARNGMQVLTKRGKGIALLGKAVKK